VVPILSKRYLGFMFPYTQQQLQKRRKQHFFLCWRFRNGCDIFSLERLTLVLTI
jgi:hypothetical protein